MADKDQTFSFDTVAVLVATITQNGGSLGAKEFKQMSALDGTRGEHGFNHMFRKVKARAKELNDQAKAGGEMTPVKKGTGAAGASAKKEKAEKAEKKSGGEGGKKRARKPKKDEDAEDAEDEDGKEESPSKKVKAEPEEDGEEDEPAPPNYEFEF